MTLNDKQVVSHLAEILNYMQSPSYQSQDISLISGALKKKKMNELSSNPKRIQNSHNDEREWKFCRKEEKSYRIQNFEKENKKLSEAGIFFGSDFAYKIQIVIAELGKRENVEEIKFWGIINGTKANYYVLQGLKNPVKTHEETPKGSQKQGEGVNYYSFWVSNNPFSNDWSLLPNITCEQMTAARKIKKLFTGNLNQKISSQVSFPGVEKHYLKAQIARITHSLQLVPKGIYKMNDENPKIVEFEDEVKFPEFADISTIEGWFHKNQMILGLGRCSHYIDLSLPEEEIEAKTAFLAENDPQCERLRALTEDKVPQSMNMGIQNPWIIKTGSNKQVFTKQQSNLVYGVVILKNVFWPGWTTIGYREGFSNIYIGNGHKISQAALDNYTNPDIAQQYEQFQEVSQPNPKQLPPQKPEGQENNEGAEEDS